MSLICNGIILKIQLYITLVYVIFLNFSDINFCKCQQTHQIPPSRISFFKSNLFHRQSNNLITIQNLPALTEEEISIDAENVFSANIADDDNEPLVNDAIKDVTDPNYQFIEKQKHKKRPSVRNRLEYPEVVSTIGKI